MRSILRWFSHPRFDVDNLVSFSLSSWFLDFFCIHSSVISVYLICAFFSMNANAAEWADVESFAAADKFEVLWGIEDGTRGRNFGEASRRGFGYMWGRNPFVDYIGNHKEDVSKFIGRKNGNPWRQPAFLEKTVRKNIDSWSGGAFIYHDFEVGIDYDVKDLWAKDWAQSGSLEDFTKNYYEAWARWFEFPLQVTRTRFPNSRIGIYDFQPYQLPLADFEAGSRVVPPWRTGVEIMLNYLEPLIDFYVCGIYPPNRKPVAIFHMANNLMESAKAAALRGLNKPVYAFAWLRLREGAFSSDQPEAPDFLVEAQALLPFFFGADGIVLWGYEPDQTEIKPPYERLSLFVRSLKRIEKFLGRKSINSEGNSNDVFHAFKSRQPLVKTVRLAEEECVVLAVDPWIGADESTSVYPSCGTASIKVYIRGNKYSIFHFNKGKVEVL